MTVQSPRTRTRLVLAVLAPLAAAVLAPASSIADAPSIRPVPYPHRHVITFSNDADMQVPSWVDGFQRLVNGGLGLPIATSLWVVGPEQSGQHTHIFSSSTELNRAGSDVEAHPVFGLLVRGWHHGTYDHFHGWDEDNAHRLIDRVNLKLQPGRVEIDLSPVPSRLDCYEYENLRLRFDALTPDDLALELEDRLGRRVRIGPEAVRRARSVFLAQAFVDLLIRPGLDAELRFDDAKFSLVQLKRIILKSRSAEADRTVLRAIERDCCSRRTALVQSPLLLKWNIRPVYLSSHGGMTVAMNVGAPVTVARPSQTGTTWELANVDHDLTPLGSTNGSHAFIADVLERHGVKVVWDWPGSYVAFDERPALDPASRSPFYILRRTGVFPRGEHQSPIDTRTAKTLTASLEKLDPAFSRLDVSSAWVPDPAFGGPTQGSFAGLLIGLGLDMVDRGEQVEHFWYTHFGTLSWTKPLVVSREKPLPESIETWFRRLGRYHYGVGEDLTPTKRVWVPGTATYVRYRLVQPQLREHLTVKDSQVAVRSWVCPVTSATIPDPSAGTRDLDGTTVYVSDPAIATVTIDGKPIHTFTRNATDETGRRSITVVDDHLPEVIIGRVPLDERGTIAVENGRVEHPIGKNLQLEATSDGRALLRFHPRALTLWNTRNIHLSARKTGTGRIFFELHTKENGVVRAVEAGEPDGAGWNIPTAAEQDGWVHHTLAVDQLRWPNTDAKALERPGAPWLALPLGEVFEVVIGVDGARRGDRLTIDRFDALRSSGNGVSPDRDKLVMGRVTSAEGKPLARVVVMAAVLGEAKAITTSTDADGYYAFYTFKKGSLVAIRAKVGSDWHAPLVGRTFELAKDEAAVDIAATALAKEAK